jgi:hypothetical protein
VREVRVDTGRKTHMFRFIELVVVLLTSLGISNFAVSAQQPGQWSPDEQIPGYLDDTLTPYLLADQNRTVHAFVSQWVGVEDPQLAIVYRQWSLDRGWTPPVDILLPPDGEAQIYGAFLDQIGVMHLIFWGGTARAANIYYSRAQIYSADRAPAWSTPELIGENALQPGSAALAGDNNGNLVIIYSGNIVGNGVYALYSSDSGDTWSEPEPIFLTYNPELVPFSLRLYMGQAGQLHAVWNVVTSTGIDMSVHYARLDVASQQWSDPFLLEQRIDKEGFFGPSFPAIVDNGDHVVVMYNSGNPVSGGAVDAGRPVMRVRMSADGGRTWSDPITPFPRHVGRSGEHSLVVDSNHFVHALFMQRIELSVNGKYTVIDGPWHSVLRGERWSEPEQFITRLSPSDIRAVVSQGNVLLVTWREDPGAGQKGVWYSYTNLDAPELAVVLLPTPTAVPTATPTLTAMPIDINPTPPPGLEVALHEPVPSGDSGDPGRSLMRGVMPVILVLAGIIVVRQVSRHRR